MTFLVSLPLKRALLCVTVVLLAVLEGAATGKVLIVQTNAAGDNIHLIDPATNTVVGEITGIEVPHGAAAAPDGARFYITNESQETVDVVDGKTLKVIKQIPLTGRPNNIAIGKNGRRVYAAVAQAPGAVDVIDTVSLERVKSIPIKGAVHNTYVTPDGRFVVAGSIAGRNMTVIDAQTEELAWMLSFENGVRPIAFETNPDGSTKRAFVQITNFHGFFVIDWAQRKEVARMTLPEIPVEKRHLDTLQGSPSHGIGVTPDGKSLWACSKINGHIYGYSLPDLKLLGGVQVGDHPDWLTFTPDSRFVYVANAGSNSVSAVDIAARKEVARIKVGQVPKRVITAVQETTPDFQAFRTRVEPILMQPRPGNSEGPGGSCFVCHTRVTSRLKLQPLATGATGWTEEQSRKNYAAVLRLVVPGDPLKSRLLLHPLAAEAGGDPSHAGGKYWTSQEAGEFQTIAAWVRTGSAGTPSPPVVLDYEAFRTKIQPILLKKRPGAARCVTCHARANNFLQPLTPASVAWTEEQSRKNFDAITVRMLVVPGDPQSSRLLMMPLAHEAGGDPFHPGGKHWESQSDPEWQTMAAWIRGRD